MVRFLVESGACLFASTLSDLETPAEKCEEDEEGFDGCSEYLYSKLIKYLQKQRKFPFLQEIYSLASFVWYPIQVFKRNSA